MLNCSVSVSDVTLDVNFSERWARLNPYSIGNRELNNHTKLILDLIFPFSKMCDNVKSLSLFILPAIKKVIRGEIHVVFIDKASMRISCSALTDFDNSFLAYPVVGV